MPVQAQFCGNCFFAVPASPDASTVHCARFPPTPYLERSNVDGTTLIRSMFPVMMAKGWCGEWQMMGEKN